MIWLKKISRVFHVSKCRGKSLETFYDEICLLSVFFSQVILIANCHSFKMRYWGGLYDYRKNYGSHFSGDTWLKYSGTNLGQLVMEIWDMLNDEWCGQLYV